MSIDSDEEASSGEGESEKYAGAPALESDDEEDRDVTRRRREDAWEEAHRSQEELKTEENEQDAPNRSVEPLESTQKSCLAKPASRKLQ